MAVLKAPATKDAAMAVLGRAEATDVVAVVAVTATAKAGAAMAADATASLAVTAPWQKAPRVSSLARADAVVMANSRAASVSRVGMDVVKAAVKAASRASPGRIVSLAKPAATAKDSAIGVSLTTVSPSTAAPMTRSQVSTASAPSSARSAARVVNAAKSAVSGAKDAVSVAAADAASAVRAKQLPPAKAPRQPR